MRPITRTLLAVAVLAVLPLAANAESNTVTTGSANARLDFQVTIPRVLMLQVGAANSAIDQINFDMDRRVRPAWPLPAQQRRVLPAARTGVGRATDQQRCRRRLLPRRLPVRTLELERGPGRAPFPVGRQFRRGIRHRIRALPGHEFAWLRRQPQRARVARQQLRRPGVRRQEHPLGRIAAAVRPGIGERQFRQLAGDVRPGVPAARGQPPVRVVRLRLAALRRCGGADRDDDRGALRRTRPNRPPVDRRHGQVDACCAWAGRGWTR